MIGTSETSIVTLVTLDDIERLLPTLPEKPYCLDLETTGFNPRQEKLVALMFGTEKRVCVLDCRPYNGLSEREQERWKGVLIKLCEKLCHVQCVGHNLKFDGSWLATYFGITLQNCCDTLLQEQIIHSTGSSEKSPIRVGLGDTAARYGIACSKEARSWFIGLNHREDEWSAPFPQEQLDYMQQDITVPLQIAACQQERLTELELLDTAELENRCLPAIISLECAGLKIDVAQWRAIVDRKTVERDLLEGELQKVLSPHVLDYRYAKHQKREQERVDRSKARDAFLEYLKSAYNKEEHGPWGTYKTTHMKEWTAENPMPSTIPYDTTPINLGSHVQLKTALESLGIVCSGTDKTTLSRVAGLDGIIQDLLAWKELAKFVSAFGDKLLDRVEPNGRIYPQYNQIGASTGRMSSSKPNFQQIPSHMKAEDNVRKCVVAEVGNCLIVADLPNIEMRILAELSLDPVLLDIFKRGLDAHSQIACTMFGLEHAPKNYDQVARTLSPYGKKYRDIAKTINFGLCYGMGVLGLADLLRVEKEIAEQSMQNYFEALPQVKRYLEEASEQAVRIGYSTTIGGRKRFYKHLEEPDRSELEWDEYMAARSFFYKWMGVYSRQAKNAPIQGTNADILKYGLVLLHNSLPSHTRIVTVVHDEVVLEAPQEQSQAMAKLLSQCLYKACKYYLRTVVIPEIETCSNTYWTKE